MQGRSLHAGVMIITTTDPIRASTGSPRRSLQPGPIRTITRAESTHKRGNNGGNVIRPDRNWQRFFEATIIASTQSGCTDCRVTADVKQLLIRGYARLESDRVFGAKNEPSHIAPENKLVGHQADG